MRDIASGLRLDCHTILPLHRGSEFISWNLSFRFKVFLPLINSCGFSITVSCLSLQTRRTFFGRFFLFFLLQNLNICDGVISGWLRFRLLIVVVFMFLSQDVNFFWNKFFLIFPIFYHSRGRVNLIAFSWCLQKSPQALILSLFHRIVFYLSDAVFWLFEFFSQIQFVL